MDMGRSPGVVVIAPGISPRLDGDEFVVAGAVGLRPSRPGEIRIERRGMLVDYMDVTPAGISLPNLDQCIGHAATVFIQHMTVHNDALAERLTFLLGGEIAVVLAHRLVAVNRAGQFR